MSRFTQLPKLFPAIIILFILLFTNNGSILAQEPTPPTAETLPPNSAAIEEQTLAVENTSALAALPPQGCWPGTAFDTCAFYIGTGGDDAGIEAVNYCTYSIGWNEIYFGSCPSGASSLSGLRFPNVAIDPYKDILSSYLEFTVDGPYTYEIRIPVYGEASLTPNPFDPFSMSDLTNRPTVPPVVNWNILSSNLMYNMGDYWSLSNTRRSADVTPILEAVMAQPGWLPGNPVAFLFKNMVSDPIGHHRRVVGYERPPSTYSGAVSRLVVRQGQIPMNSLSYYWVSATYNYDSNTTIFIENYLRTKGAYEANKNQPSLVILDFGNPLYNNKKVGTTLLMSPDSNVPTKIPASTMEIEEGVKNYIRGFMDGVPNNPQARLWLGVGTNNAGDVLCSKQIATNHGIAWAAMVNDLNTWINQQGFTPTVYVSGASDFETWLGKQFKCNNKVVDPAPPQNALAWANAYNANTSLPLIDYGTMEDTTIGLGNNEWGADVFWQLAWGLPNNYPLPEIYTTNGSTAANWAFLARVSAVCINCLPETIAADPGWTKGRKMFFLGTLTEYGDTKCTGSNPPQEGWKQLYRKLVVDMNTDINPFQYSSDISFDTSIYKADWCPDSAPW